MSTHSRLQKKRPFLETYRNEIEKIRNKLQPLNINIPEKKTGKHLVIVIGSQKGLCGSFNNRIITLLENHHPIKTLQHYNRPFDLIGIGSKILERFHLNDIPTTQAYPTFNASNFVAIAHELSLLILETYSKVTFYSNKPVSFFLQETKTTEVRIPTKVDPIANTPVTNETEYIFEQSPRFIQYYIEKMHMQASIDELLFKSLVAEQASRFVSMDLATRNAEDLNGSMIRDYNKLRQSLITREITDLAGSII